MDYGSIQKICSEIFAHYEGKTAILCALCPTQLKRAVGKDNSQKKSTLIDHACIHLNKPLYFCRHCDFQFTAKRNMRTHLWASHSLNSTTANYSDNSAKYYSEIAETIKRCFVRQEPLTTTTPCKTRTHPFKWVLNLLAFHLYYFYKKFLLEYLGNWNANYQIIVGNWFWKNLPHRFVAKTAKRN